MTDHFKGVILAIISGILWAFSGICGEFLFKFKNIDPIWLTSIRLFFSGIILFILVFIRVKFKIFEIFKDKKGVIDLIFFSVFGLGICQLTYYFTIHYSNTAIATTLQYTAPAMIMLYVCLKEKNLPKLNEFLALICAIIGVFLFATHADFSKLSISLEALIIGLISAICVAIYSLAPIKINKLYGTTTVLSISLTISGFFFFIFFKAWNFPNLDFLSILAIFGILILGTIFGFSLYLTSVNFIGAKKASLIASIEPAMAGIFGYIFFNTNFVIYDILGFLLIILCTFLISKK